MYEIVSSFDNKVRSRGFGGLAVLLLLGGAGCIGEGGEDVTAITDTTDISDITEVTSAITGPSGHDYRFFVTPATWNQARATCASLMGGYHLVTITTPQEDAWLLAQERTFGGAWWFGYSDQSSEGAWRWSDSTTNGYVNWQPGEPNNQGNEDCGMHNGFTSGKWNDSNCNNSLRFVCENGTDTQLTQLSWNGLENTNSATVNYLQFAFDLAFDTGITIGTCEFNFGDRDDTYLRLFNPSGVQVAENDDFCGWRGRASQISARGAVFPTGTYVIRAGCYANTKCDGTVQLMR